MVVSAANPLNAENVFNAGLLESADTKKDCPEQAVFFLKNCQSDYFTSLSLPDQIMILVQ
jgi:hypothetical protein